MVFATRLQPNIVLILVDDMRFSDIGCCGGEIPTPNIDRLAASSVRFTQFYNNARCSLTRTSSIPHCAQTELLDPSSEAKEKPGDRRETAGASPTRCSKCPCADSPSHSVAAPVPGAEPTAMSVVLTVVFACPKVECFVTKEYPLPQFFEIGKPVKQDG